FIVPASQKGRLMETMEDAIRCGNSTPQIPCGNSAHFRDSFSSLPSEASPKTVPQYGMETEPEDGWVDWPPTADAELALLNPTALVLELVSQLPTVMGIAPTQHDVTN